MKKRKFKFWPLIGIVLPLGILVFVVVAAARLYTQPLGPALEPSSLGAPAAEDVAQVTSTPTTEAAKVAAPALKKTPPGICDESAVWNVLILGSDAQDLYYPQGADLTRVLRVDFLNRKVTIFAFSRDLWVDAKKLKLENPEIKSTRLGMVFYEARRRSIEADPNDVMLDGVNAMAKTLASNFKLNSDHYLALDLDKLPEMVDTIGGVPINIKTGFTDPLSGMVFVAGEQTLNGIQTSTYARAFLDTDLNRIERNNLLVKAMRQQLLDSTVWVKIPDLFVLFKDAFITDFSPEQMNHLACLLKEVQPESIILDGVKPEWTEAGPEGSLLWSKTNVLSRLKELGMIP